MSFILSEDEALKELLKSIKVSDEKNNNRSVPVYYAYPDVEERSQSYPYLTLELVDTTWARNRQTSGYIVDPDAQGTIEHVEGLAYTYETPVAWDLMYQVTSYARHPRHDRAILATILNRIFKNNRGMLPVKNDLGTETGYRHMLLQEFTKRDTVEDGRRLYRSVFTVIVASEGDITVLAPNANVLVTDVEINTITEDIPADKQIV